MPRLIMETKQWRLIALGTGCSLSLCVWIVSLHESIMMKVMTGETCQVTKIKEETEKILEKLRNIYLFDYLFIYLFI